MTKRIIRETRILSTRDGLESLDDVEVAPEHFKMVQKEVRLSFEDSNKEMFNPEEEVTLKLQIKNVQ